MSLTTSLTRPIPRPIPSPLASAGGGGFAAIIGPGSLAPYVTFTRASSGTYFDSAGVMQAAASNEPRYDYNPATLAYRGLLIEGARTNLVLNSATLVTQSVTVTATAHTLSFYGTGTVTLSGTSTAGPLVGTGANDRVTLTFTPTAGSLTLTVSGSVTLAQLEAGAFASSYIPTTGAAATRAADSLIVSDLANMNYNQSEGTVYAEVSGPQGQTSDYFQFNNATINEGSFYYSSVGTSFVSAFRDGGVSQATLAVNATITSTRKIATAYALNDFVSVSDGGTPATDASGTLGTPTRLVAGASASNFGSELKFAWLREIRYYPKRLTNAAIIALTALVLVACTTEEGGAITSEEGGAIAVEVADAPRQ